jgi:hypothetical protein
MAALFQPIELASLLRRQVQAGGVVTAQELAATWLRAATGLSTFPDPLPEDLHGWALELGAIAYDSRELGTAISPLVHQINASRRREILAAAGRAYGPAGAGSGGPQGSFPAACGYPDPAIGNRWYDPSLIYRIVE